EKPDTDGLFYVELKDTVIFPEGGGQPSDTGHINGVGVKYARRDGLRAIHYVDEPIPVGARVRVEVDFAQRLDNMQQHSGQHLLSAILSRGWGLETVSWSLGDAISYVELQTSKESTLPQAMLDAVEDKCNDIVLEALPINIHMAEQGSEAQPSTVPADYVGGVIRHVEIGVAETAIDKNA
ncbi:hypothetical protein GGI02_005738, partial [Coemansia sp. RSA 2322]